MKKSNSYLQLKNYFEELVQNATFLENFAGYFRRELVQKDSNDELSAPYLALFNYGMGAF